jgi:hypothetical protein
MKAQARPSSVLPYLLCCLICLYAISTPASPVYAKTRLEVQMGDPTDTDPGPNQTTAVKVAGVERVWIPSVRRPGTSVHWLLDILVHMFLKYGSV